MRSVLVAAYDTMQKELKDFLIACIKEDDDDDDHDRRNHQTRRSRHANEPNDSRGLFSLGITEAHNKKDNLSLQPESRANQMQQNASKCTGTSASWASVIGTPDEPDRARALGRGATVPPQFCHKFVGVPP